MLWAAAAQTSNRREDEAVQELLAGIKAATPASSAVGSGSELEAPALIIVHTGEARDPDAFVQALGRAYPTAGLVGASAEGVIGPLGSDEGRYAAGAFALGGAGLEVETRLFRNLSADPAGRGMEIVHWLEALSLQTSPKLMLIFPDGLSADCGSLVRGLDEALAQSSFATLPVVGASAADGLKMQSTWQCAAAEIASDALAVAVLAGPLVAVTGVSHGCGLVGPEMTVTGAEGASLQALDGRPPWELFSDYLEEEDLETLEMREVLHLCLACRLPSTKGRPGELVIHSPVAHDAQSGAMFFPGGLQVGDRVQLALRDPEKVAESCAHSVAELALQRPGERPAVILHFDCAGRGRLLFGNKLNERLIFPMREAFDLAGERSSGAPPWETPVWFGFHSYAEIAPLGGRPQLHQYTVALCALFDQVNP